MEYKNKGNYYLSNKKDIVIKKIQNLSPMNLMLYHIEEITFEEKAPRREALENVLSSVKIEGINFVYLILGDENGVHFYFGIAKDLYYEENPILTVKDIGDYILEPNIRGNFRGSKISEVAPVEKRKIQSIMDDMNYFSCLEGVPGVLEDKEKFQGADRLVDVMLGDEFGFMILAKPMNFNSIMEIEENLNDLYTKIAPLSKKSMQDSKTSNTGSNKSKNETTSESSGSNSSESTQNGKSTTTGENKGTSDTETKGKGTSTTKGTSSNSGGSSNSNGTSNSVSESVSESGAKGTTSGTSTSVGTSSNLSKSKGINSSTSKSVGITTGTNEGESIGSSQTVEFLDKELQDWIKYIDEVVVSRLDYGKGKGIFNTSTFLFASKKAVLKKLENTMKSLFAGDKGNRVPLMSFELEANSDKANIYKNFQIPHGNLINKKDACNRVAISQYSNKDGEVVFGNWISSNELSLIAGLPQKEVVGLGLREEVQFGLNVQNNIEEKNKLHIGSLVHSGHILNNIKVNLDKKNLDKHVFITGVTGSGKTTTCQKILMDSELPFLVIEPAKTEYRILAKKYDDILIFTLGKDTVAPFRINPFEFFEHESITSRVDMIKASLEAAFDMEAAIPQILETTIYKCYEDYGWNIATNKNELIENPFDDGVYAFPTFSDLLDKVKDVVDEQGFDDRLKNDYIGSIKARLGSLVVGSKGLMLNTRRSIDFEKLLDKKVVLELEEIRSGNEKSLVMGFVLVNLVEAIKAKFKKQGKFNHITLVEEAHRLLSKYSAGDSLNKKQGVETFTDMLAEIRKYGESLIIVDQIPNKLTPEVLKNTNTKIVHKIFAQDDKEAIGNTMILSDEQKDFLSNLDAGRAIVFTQGFQKALQVQIEKTSDTTEEEALSEEGLRNNVIKFYCENYKNGTIVGLNAYDDTPTVEQFEWLSKFMNENLFFREYKEFKVKSQPVYKNEVIEALKQDIKNLDIDFIAKIIFKYYHHDLRNHSEEEYIELIKKLINQYTDKNIKTENFKRKLWLFR